MKQSLKYLRLIFAATLTQAACSQGANLNGSTGSGKAGAGAGAQSDRSELEAKDKGGHTPVDASGAQREVLKDGRIRLTYKGENQSVMAPVDIVFIIDTSGSMDEERKALEQNLTNFLSQIASASTSLDYYTWILASPFTPPLNANGKIEVVQRRVRSTDALSHLKDFLMAVGKPAPLKSLRDEARKQIIIITDDDATGVVSTDIANLVSSNPKLVNKVSIHGIVGLVSGSVSKTCSIANVGKQYQALSATPATKGIILDLCSNDWSKLLTSLAAQIVTDVRKSTFQISERLDDTKNIEVTVGGTTVPVGGYTYDPAASKITLNSAFAPAPDQELVITYQPAK